MTATNRQAAKIVAAYVHRHATNIHDLPALIATVNEALSSLGQEPILSEPLVPAVPIKRSIADNAIICLDCGWKGQMMRRHLANRHGLTPGSYRERWHLPADYPMVSRFYSSRRSELALALGLGRRGQKQAVPSEAVSYNPGEPVEEQPKRRRSRTARNAQATSPD
jgi:predicted transcriptional regulator